LHIHIEQPPWLKRVGTLLLLFARQRSLELGYGGRVGLHSLPLDSNLIREMFFNIHAVMQKPDDFYIVAFHAIKNQVALLVIASIT
jgi:hypothetical protein